MAKILVVDDDPSFNSMLCSFLSRNNYQAEKAFSAESALSVFKSKQFDLVLTDFKLPDMDGLKLIAHIKQDKPNLPVILITNYSDIRIAVKSIKLGAYDFVTKPVVPDELLIIIKKALETKDLRLKKISKKYVFLKNKKIKYDYLVLASGSSYSLPIKELNVSLPSRLGHLKKNEKKLKNSKDVIIIGGGIVGVELASEIATCNKKRKISIYTSGNILMPRNNIKTSKLVKKFLEKKMVSIFFNSKIKVNKSGIFKNNRKIKSDIVFLATGVKNNIDFIPKEMNIINKNMEVIVDKNLRVVGYNNIFAGGDIINTKEEKLAQNAEAHGKIIARNIILIESKNKLKKYMAKKRMILISLGKSKGIVEYKNMSFMGIVPLIMKNIIEKIHLKKMSFL